MEARDLVRRQLYQRTLEMDVLDEVCQTRRTESAIKLTHDLIKRRRILRFGDPLGLVSVVLLDLNRRGLVVYTERDENGVPLQIRATDDGFHEAGYRLRLSETGARTSRLHHPQADDGGVRHPGDRTDFRVHDDRATALGPIERMTLREHVWLYLDHAQVHWAQLMEVDEMARAGGYGERGQYNDDLVQRIVALRRDGATWPMISKETGIPAGTLSSTTSVLNRAVVARLREDGATEGVAAWIGSDALRARVAVAVAQRGPYAVLDDLVHDVRHDGKIGSVSYADVMGAVHRLNRAGDLSIVERRIASNGHTPQSEPAKITATPRLYARLGIEKPRREPPKQNEKPTYHPPYDEGKDDWDTNPTAPIATVSPEPEAATPQPETPAPVESVARPEWPVLDQLRARRAEQATLRARADHYLEAAALLDDPEGTDKPIVDALVASAEAIAEQTKMSPAEAEYLAYADAQEASK